MNNKILPIILSGGTGSRLWPLSRASFPKQFLEKNISGSISFLQGTMKRVNSYKEVYNPIVVCNEDHRFIVAEQLRKINVKAKSILLEPIRRNTAPAVTCACFKAIEDGENPIVLVLPADHIIQDSESFLNVIQKATKYVNDGELVTFGITPTKAETGFGYIKSKNELNIKDLNGERILEFIEKPDKKLAKKFIKDKRYTWNSGIFFFRANTFLNEVLNHSPKIYDNCKKSLVKNTLDLDFQRLDHDFFSSCEDISIDKAIMEKTKLGTVIPLNAGWSDIGSWESMWEVSDKDERGNTVLGKVISKNVNNSYLRSEGRLMVCIGVTDMVIVETQDAILVVNKKESQKVKDIVKQIEKQGFSEASIHKTIYRPWGNYTSISEGKNWQVKKIMVEPGQSLSLQLHNHRTEHWIIVSGAALVEINGKQKLLKQNESTYIPLASKHRVTNTSEYPLVMIEVQSGSYLGEDDIVRFEDNYGRLDKFFDKNS